MRPIIQSTAPSLLAIVLFCKCCLTFLPYAVMADFHLCAPEVVNTYPPITVFTASQNCINALEDHYLVKTITVLYRPLEF